MHSLTHFHSSSSSSISSHYFSLVALTVTVAIAVSLALVKLISVCISDRCSPPFSDQASSENARPAHSKRLQPVAAAAANQGRQLVVLFLSQATTCFCCRQVFSLWPPTKREKEQSVALSSCVSLKRAMIFSYLIQTKRRPR